MNRDALAEFCHRDQPELRHVHVATEHLVACDAHRLLMVRGVEHSGKPGELLFAPALLEGVTAVVRGVGPYPVSEAKVNAWLAGERRHYRFSPPDWLSWYEERAAIAATLVDPGNEPVRLQLGAEPQFGGLVSFDLRLLKPLAGREVVLAAASDPTEPLVITTAEGARDPLAAKWCALVMPCRAIEEPVPLLTRWKPPLAPVPGDEEDAS